MDGRSLLPLLDADGGNDLPDWRTACDRRGLRGADRLQRLRERPRRLKLIWTMPSDPLGAWKYVGAVRAHRQDPTPAPPPGASCTTRANDMYETNNLAVANPAPGSPQAQGSPRGWPCSGQTQGAGAAVHGRAPAVRRPTRSASFVVLGGRRVAVLVLAGRRPAVAVHVAGGLCPDRWRAGPHTFTVVAEGEDVPDGVTGTSGAGRFVPGRSTTARPDTTITGRSRAGPTSSTTAQFSFTSDEPGGHVPVLARRRAVRRLHLAGFVPGTGGDPPHVRGEGRRRGRTTRTRRPTRGRGRWTWTPPDTSNRLRPERGDQPAGAVRVHVLLEPIRVDVPVPSLEGGNFAACTSPYEDRWRATGTTRSR